MPSFMRRRPSPLLRVASLLLIAAGAGCGDKPASSRDTAQAVAPASTVDSGQQAGAPPTPPKLYGRRPGKEPEKWREYVRAIRPRPARDTTRDRGCARDPGEHDDCRLVVAPVENSHNVDTTAVDDSGYVIARLENIGTLKEAFFGIEAKQVVFWRVFRRSTEAGGGPPYGQLVSQFLDSATGRPIRRPRLKPSETYFDVPRHYGPEEFPFKACSPRHSTQTAPSAKFWTCAQARVGHDQDSLQAIAAASGTAARSETLGRLPKSTIPLRQHNSPAWIACIQGCCAVEEGGP